MRPFWRILFALWGVVTALSAQAQGSRILNAEGEAEPPLSANEAGQQIREAQLALKAAMLTPQGKTDYAAAQKSQAWQNYRKAAARLRSVPLADLKTTEEKTAFWINLYNALVTDGLVSLKVKESVLRSPGFFQRVRYQVGAHSFSLDEIEHGILRGNRRPPAGNAPPFKQNDPRLAFALPQADPRVHFALNCGARSCPPIRSYTAEKLDSQLELAARSFVGGPDVQIDETKNQISLSKLFEWYAEDFGPDKRDPLRFVLRYLPDGAAKTYFAANLDRIKVRYLPYDWTLYDG